MSALAVTPSGHLILSESPPAAPLPEAPLRGLRKAFAQGSAAGLLHLTTLRHEGPLPADLAFWRRFGERYLTELCHIPEPTGELAAALPPPSDAWPALLAAAPPMRGGEYLREEVLEQLWTELDALARSQIAATAGGLAAWLQGVSPLWHRVGRVSFHLAENKRDAAYPFAFLATYAPRLLDGRRVQYQPLGKALEQYAGARNRKTLAKLLTPVQRAAERCAWVRDLIDSGAVFHPLRWTPGEAHRLLKDAPLLEECGLLVRMPDWWTKTPPRVRVSVAVGSKRQPRVGADALLDFRLDLAMDGQALSEEEWQEVLAGSDDLVLLKGRWVEVDRERLAKVLERWKEVEREAGEGVSFIEGMRLLAGASLDPERADLFEGEAASWAEVHAGPWLAERLQALRAPQSIEAALPGKELRATLRPYQQDGVKWLAFLAELGLGACLADDMGLGKTIQVIALLLLRKRQRKGRRGASLLVLPASLLANWKAELERFAPSLTVRFAHPSLARAEDLAAAARDGEGFVGDADVVLTSYAMLARQPWLQSLRWDLAVLDEAQAVKNPTARQTRCVKQLSATARIALTGTPVENRLGDLWSIFDFLCPGLLGGSKAFGTFVKRLEKSAAGQYAPLRRLVGPYILRRLKTDRSIIADLPEKTEMQAYCRLTKKQAALYERSVEELSRQLDQAEGIQRRGVILAFLMRLKQICNHPAQWLGTGDYVPAESGKFARLAELAETFAERQEKVLVFTQFREMAEPLAAFLAGVFGRGGLVLHGEVPVKKRKRLVDDFQREEGPPFFVLSLKAGGTGLNLTAASQVVHFDRWWNPAVENQATDRAFRIGQRKNVVVHKFLCQGTVEEKIDAVIREKTALAEAILEGEAPRLITEMSDAELLDLVRLDVSTVTEE